MKLVRHAGLAASILMLGALVFLPGPNAAGQSANPPPAAGQAAREAVPQSAYYPQSGYYGQAYAPLQGPNNSAPYWYNPVVRYGAGHNDPEMHKLLIAESAAEREAAGLIKEYGRTEEEGKRDKVKSKLADVLGKEFDLQQKRRELELTRLEAQVKKVRELLNKRTEQRKTIVDKRLDQIIREAEGLGWTAPAGVNLPTGNFFPPASALPATPQAK